MTKESVLSFFLALGVVSGSLYAFAFLGGMGSMHKAIAAPLPPAVAQTATPAARPAAPAMPEPLKTALKEGAEIAQAEVPEDEDTAGAENAAPRCKVLAHQLRDIDGALAYPLSQPLRDYYDKHHRMLKDERTALGC